MQDRLNQDLKTALLAGDKRKVEILKVLKSTLQYEAVGRGAKAESLSDDEVQKVLARESKKRQEAADIYSKVSQTERMQAELDEKAIIDSYLPSQLSEAEIGEVVKEEIAIMGASAPKDMGRVIGAVKDRLKAQADGATVARLAREMLEQAQG